MRQARASVDHVARSRRRRSGRARGRRCARRRAAARRRARRRRRAGGRRRSRSRRRRRPRLVAVMAWSWRPSRTSPRAIRSSSGSVTEQEPNEVNQRRARRAASVAGEGGAVALLEHVGRVGDGAAVPEHLRRGEHVEEAVRAAALGVVAYGAVQAGGRLEAASRGRARRRSSAATVPASRDEVVVDVAEAQLEPVVAGGDLVGGRQPGGGGRPGELDEDRARRRSAAPQRRRRSGGRCRPGRRRRGPRSRGRHLRARAGPPAPQRPGELARRPPVTHHRQRPAEPADRAAGRCRASTKRADEVGVPLAARARRTPRWRRGGGRRRAGRSRRRRPGRATASGHRSDGDRCRTGSHAATLATR